MPSIMNKIESYLLVKELNARLFENAIIEQQLLIALSTPAAWTEFNYERLEFLGKPIKLNKFVLAAQKQSSSR